MQLATYKGERNLTDLVHRVYRIEGGGARIRTEEAVEALLKANPHLRDLSEVPVGALIVLPTVQPHNGHEEVRPVSDMARDVLIQAEQAFNDFQSVLHGSIDNQRNAAAETSTLINSKKFKQLVGKVPELRKRVPKITEAVDTKRRDAEVRSQSYKIAAAIIAEDFRDLKALLP